MKSSLIIRIIGLLIVGSTGVALGNSIAPLLIQFSWFPLSVTQVTIIIGLLGGILGFFLTPLLVTRPVEKLRNTIQQLPAQTLLSITLGLFIGLAFGALSAYPISLMPQPFGEVLPVVGAIGFGYLGMTVATSRPELFQSIRTRIFPKETAPVQEQAVPAQQSTPVLLDTSVIIDGRIADICRTGFIQGELIVPLFVLNELQHVADSADTLRRNRGRRGLEILRQLQDDSPIPVRLTDADDISVREVDDKLIALAKELEGAILTNDYNLNRVAELQSVRVLNVNELANAVKTVLLPGESFTIHVLQEGKESNQGVGYLDDGTMVVLEDGARYIGATVDVTVSKVLQTAAGRMIFARPGDERA
ncbi:MAG: TRAM domain-containing protein [Anaerolineae bacterium]|nr:TRAM domain-containing protein [Anaerolineae bacterium]